MPIYVYYMIISKQKDEKDSSSKYDISEIIDAFTRMLKYTIELDLQQRKYNNLAIEKVIWLDSYSDLGNGNYNLVFKSAKYNHVRNEIDTETMQPLGQRKRPQDGDEERTHLCVRLANGQIKFLAIHESNHYGISIKSIVDYLNSEFVKLHEQSDDAYFYQISSEIVPSDTFLNQLKKAKSISMLRLEVDKELFKDDFWALSGRNDVKESIDVIIKRPKHSRYFPDNLIKSYYDNMQSDNRIKSITVSGKGAAKNSMEISTDLIKMKHCISVEMEDITYEVNSSDFFSKAQSFVDEMMR